MKNHEGYNDPTAGMAIRHNRRWNARKIAPVHLTYLLGEIPGFPDTGMILEKHRTCRKHTEKEKKPSKNDKKV